MVLYTEEIGSAGLYIVGKVSRISIEWAAPVAGLLGFGVVR